MISRLVSLVFWPINNLVLPFWEGLTGFDEQIAEEERLMRALWTDGTDHGRNP